MHCHLKQLLSILNCHLLLNGGHNLLTLGTVEFLRVETHDEHSELVFRTIWNKLIWKNYIIVDRFSGRLNCKLEHIEPRANKEQERRKQENNQRNNSNKMQNHRTVRRHGMIRVDVLSQLIWSIPLVSNLSTTSELLKIASLIEAKRCSEMRRVPSPLDSLHSQDDHCFLTTMRSMNATKRTLVSTLRSVWIASAIDPYWRSS